MIYYILLNEYIRKHTATAYNNNWIIALKEIIVFQRVIFVLLKVKVYHANSPHSVEMCI